MKLDVINLDGAKAGTIDLDEALFGLEPRADILHRVVRWQRARAQAGTPGSYLEHQTGVFGFLIHHVSGKVGRSMGGSFQLNQGCFGAS